MPIELPRADQQPQERSDAARNREALLAAAQRLIDHCGVDGVTMDAVAHEAGVGKGTVFRRFGSREGLMAAVLNRSETDWQGSVIGGPPPLGPHDDPMARLLAFGHSRLRLNLAHAALIRGAGHTGARSYAAVSFSAMHVRHLLTALGVDGDIPLLATALMAPLEVVILEQQVDHEQIPVGRIEAAWDDLVRRVVCA
ncbi:helix-turn-helix domain-containing protein [Nocardioides sp.]|uniref:TetR/AcrR family transcriptional regulator n=1 Tax=Nocardioides sp. TaxID=35761 RepID=UPI00286D7F66|nr:helix-turn-helix domain-containing protein [Nocardioides sp.]